MSYAEAARVSDVLRTQDRLIANGCDPTTSLDRLATTGPERPKANVVGLVPLLIVHHSIDQINSYSSILKDIQRLFEAPGQSTKGN
jgi:hypothetical protein